MAEESILPPPSFYPGHKAGDVFPGDFHFRLFRLMAVITDNDQTRQRVLQFAAIVRRWPLGGERLPVNLIYLGYILFAHVAYVVRQGFFSIIYTEIASYDFNIFLHLATAQFIAGGAIFLNVRSLYYMHRVTPYGVMKIPLNE